MCMALAKFRGNRLVTSSAGMPPMLIYKNSNTAIDEVIIKGMPMGAVEDFSYQQETRKLEPGDVILLMSDGLMELFNDKKEMFGFEKVKEVFTEFALKSPEEILNRLFSAAKGWRNSSPQDDDLTFIIIKVKQF
jgi:serine phosphatase RsbU (regulator of sigma subunit)